MYFPARYQYVKTSGRRVKGEGVEGLAETQRSWLTGIDGFEGFNLVKEEEMDVYQSCYVGEKEMNKEREKRSNKRSTGEGWMSKDMCLGPKCKMNMKTKIKEGIKKWKC